MNDAYNTAIKYLRDKYGYRRGLLTESSQKRLNNKNKKEREDIEKSFSDQNYYPILNQVTCPDDKVIEVLIGQYYLGIQAKKELYNILLLRGIISHSS